MIVRKGLKSNVAKKADLNTRLKLNLTPYNEPSVNWH